MDTRNKARGSEVLYVYDRICPKESKRKQLYKEYGVTRQSKCSASVGKKHVNERAYASSFADTKRGCSHSRYESQMKNAQQYRQGTRKTNFENGDVLRRQAYNGAYRSYKFSEAENVNGKHNDRSYSYKPSGAFGGEAVSERPLKLFIEKLVNLFESIEARGRRDESIAKKQAVARKKIYEYRHALLTALILVLILAAFICFVYKTFFVISDINVDNFDSYTKEKIIDAAGIENGDNLYSFSVTKAEDSITFRCPHIKSAEISRKIPNTVSIATEEDTAMYVAEIYGERLLLSAGLRVLGNAGDSVGDGIVELVLPTVDYSVAGRVISFSDEKKERFIREILTASAESYFGTSRQIKQIDLSDAYDITMCVSDMYILRIGSEEDCDLKLRTAYKTVTYADFDKNVPAYIDISKVGEASVRYDPKLSFD